MSDWRTGKKGITLIPLLAAILMFSLPALLTGCSGGGSPAAASSGSSNTSTSNNGYTIYLSPSKTSFLTDNSDSVTLTATVVKSSVSQQGVTVTFSATDGLISASSAITDVNGQASITIKSGPRASNQIVSIATTCQGATASIPLQMTGNTISMSTPQASMAIGSNQALTTTLQNATPIGVALAPVTYTILSGNGVVSLSSTTGTTDFNGQNQISITALAAGQAIIQASGLGATAQITIDVAAAAQVFEITSPTNSPASMSTSDSLVFTVNAPTQATVTFHTTVGSWNASGSTVTVAVVAGVASATLTSAETGLADITVFDAAAPATQDTFQVSIYAPASAAANITLVASQDNMPTTPTGSSTKNSITLTATVLTAGGGVVGNAQVNFTLSNQPGGGEQVSPNVLTTNSSGVATTTFYSGSRESGSAGVRITATIAGVGASDYVDVVIKSRPGSIVLGRANKITPSADNTYYQQQITAQVADANGNAVPNTTISLKLWPTAYYLGAQTYDINGVCTGYGYNHWPACVGPTAQANEDTNMNLSLDPGEDVGPYDSLAADMVADGYLTPHNSAAGTVPSTITTDANGLASFQITYLKQYSMWIRARLQASVNVQGTEAQAITEWVLEPTLEDYEACQLFPSPFGYFAEICP